MSLPGRVPKPSKLKILEGNPGHRSIPEQLEVDVIDKLEVPKWIKSKQASKIWRNIAKKEYMEMGEKLKKLGLLTDLDHAMFEAYVVCYAKWCVCESMAELAVKVTDTGYYQQHPYISMAHKFRAEMRRYIEKFGMSPSDRTRIDISKLNPPGEDDEEDFD